jgi:hypothetical protein
MKKQVSLYGYALLSLFASGTLFSCSSDGIETDDEATVTAVAVVPERETASVQAGDQSRVTNLVGSLTRALTRADNVGASLEMPVQPSIPQNALDMTDPSFQEWNTSYNVNYEVPAGKSKTVSNLNLNSSVFYVAGEFTYNGGWGFGTFYVLPGGTLTLNAMPGNGFEIYNYGTLNLPSEEVYVGRGWDNAKGGSFGYTLMTVGDIKGVKKLSSQGDVYVGGEISVDELSLGESSRLHVIGDVKATTQTVLTNSASAYLASSLTSPYLQVTASTLDVACKTIASTKIYLSNSSIYTSGGYVQTPATHIDSRAELHLAGGSLAELGDLLMNNADNTKVVVDGDSYAVATASSVSVNYNNLYNTFLGYLGLHYDKFTGSGSNDPFVFRSEIQVNDEDDTVIPEATCHPAYGKQPATPTTEPKLVIEHVAEVTPPEDHTHDFSSTCVQVVGNKAYVSYHTQGSGYGGCVEVMTFDGTSGVSLNNWMQPDYDIDFNHLIVDNNRVYATGGVKAGSFLSYIELDANGLFPSDLDYFNRVNLKQDAEQKVAIGGSGNCVVRDGNAYIITTTSGILTVNASDLTFLGYQQTPASAKYVSLDNQGNLVTLNLADKNTEAKAVINTYKASDVTLAAPVNTFTGDIITPNDGKNVCLVDGNNVYACLGKTGFKRYTNGVENGTYLANEKASYACNGMDYDDQYIYLAYGSYGLRILDKATLTEVARYTHSGGKSANFVKVSNGYIFVAYGRSGLQVFKLNKI